MKNFDILTHRSDTTKLTVTSSQISGLLKKNITRSGVRLFKESQIFSAARVGNFSADELINSIKPEISVGVPYDYELPSPFTEQVILPPVFNSKEEVIEGYRNLLSRLCSTFPDFIWSGGMEIKNDEKSFKSSMGHDLVNKRSLINWHFVFKRQGSKNMMDGYLEHESSMPRFEETFSTYKDFITATGHVIKLSSGKIPVLFIGQDWRMFDKLREGIIAPTYHEGGSLLSKKLGKKLFSDRVGLVDYARMDDPGALSTFDGEGVKRRDFKIIENGVFKEVLYDLRHAKKYHAHSTGHGHRSFDSGVRVSSFNLQLMRGQKSWKEMAREIPECIVIFIAAGGACDDNWDYSSPVQISYLMKNGEVAGQCPQLSIKGNVKDLLGERYIGTARDSFTGHEIIPCSFFDMDIIVH